MIADSNRPTYRSLYAANGSTPAPRRRPNFQTGFENFRIRPRRSATGTRPGEVGRLGDGRVLRAFNLPLYPCANVSESAREMRRDLLTRSWDAGSGASGGGGREVMRPLW